MHPPNPPSGGMGDAGIPLTYLLIILCLIPLFNVILYPASLLRINYSGKKVGYLFVLYFVV